MDGQKQFIEKAIEGGWNKGYKLLYVTDDSAVLLAHKTQIGRSIALIVSEVLLDPLAWQAVGKVEGWKITVQGCFVCGKPFTDANSLSEHKECLRDYGNEEGEEWVMKDVEIDSWKYNMHRMIDALAEGKTIEEFLKIL